MKKWLQNKRKEWHIKQVQIKKIKEKEEDIDKYTQPINLFKYNPLLNPRHNLWATRKIQKHKRIFSAIYYKINGHLRWFKWETRRQLNYKYRLMLFKKRLKKNRNRKKNKKKKIFYFSPKMLLKRKIRKLNRLIRKNNTIWKIKTKIKIKKIKKFEQKFKLKNIFNILKKKKKFFKYKKKIKKDKKKISKEKKRQLLLQKLHIKKLKKLYLTKRWSKNKKEKQKLK